jgi:hypothetical protein
MKEEDRRLVIWVWAAVWAALAGFALGRVGSTPKPSPTPTPCACEERKPLAVPPPELPTYEPEPGVETWKSLNQTHPASRPIK